MKRIIVISILLLIFTGLFAQTKDTLYILETTDVHARIFPYNYYTDEPDEIGFAQVYSRIQEYRKKFKNVILLDGGDAIQGTPMAYYFHKIENDKPNPIILAMNEMKYDAFAVGNHEIEQGVEVYTKAMNESEFPWLSANSTLSDSSTFFQPYTILEKDGIKIGVIGLTTPGIPTMLDTVCYPGITWTDMVKTAQKYAKIVRPKVDILVGLFHAGFDAGEDAYKSKQLGLPVANASGLVADSIPEFDLIFGGHSHRVKPKEKINPPVDECMKIIAGKWGIYLGVSKFVLEKKRNKWKIIDKSGWVESVAGQEPSSEILVLTSDYHDAILEYIRTNIAEIRDTILGMNSRFEDSPIVELINKAQMDYTGADISFAASFRTDYCFEPGKLQIKDAYSMYPYENFLYVAEMTGQQIRDYLEASTKYYLFDGEIVKTNPEIAGYHCSMAEGIDYEIDLSEKIGKRIKNIKLSTSGLPLQNNKKYKVALNSYRASGGGGLMEAAGAKNAPIVFKSNEEMRTILINYLMEKGSISAEVDKNWKILK